MPLKFIKTGLYSITAFLWMGLNKGFAQDSSYAPIQYSGYIETYFGMELSNPKCNQKPSFFYNYKRQNEANLNLALIQAKYNTAKVRANLAIMAGTYTQFNLSHEPQGLKNIMEANVGFSLSNHSKLWLDLGIMPSHIGFESAIGKECWNLTRSILADNSPYYESGAKISYASKNDKYVMALMYLNGWQRIQRLEANSTPAFGSQFTYKPSDKKTINWSTFIGNEQPDSLKKWRYFNNFYGVFYPTKKIGLTLGFDIGLQQRRDSNNTIIKGMDTWYAPILILRYLSSPKTRIACRLEFYKDPKEVIVSTTTHQGFETYGGSLNFDYVPIENAVIRIEARYLTSKDVIFENISNQNMYLTTAFALSF